MRIKTQIGLLVLIVLFSCSADNNNNNIKSILLQETKNVFPISSFIKDVNYIRFSSENSSFVIGQIEDLKILEKDIIIKQRIARETTMLRFSSEGKFLNEIGINGKGANEILNPKDVILYNDGYAVWDQLAIHSISKSGKYNKKLFNAHIQGNRFFYLQNNFYLFHGLSAPGYLSRYNDYGDIRQIYLPNNHEFGSTGYSKIIKLGEDKFHLFSPMLDTVYTFSNNQLIPQYQISGKPYPTFMEILKKAGKRTPPEMLKFINNNKHVVIDRYLENQDYIFISYRLGKEIFQLLIKKKDWKLTYFKKCINDIDGGLWQNPFFLSEDNVLYIPLYSYEIKAHKVVNKKRNKFEVLQNKITLDDNPVIMICKLK